MQLCNSLIYTSRLFRCVVLRRWIRPIYNKVTGTYSREDGAAHVHGVAAHLNDLADLAELIIDQQDAIRIDMQQPADLGHAWIRAPVARDHHVKAELVELPGRWFVRIAAEHTVVGNEDVAGTAMPSYVRKKGCQCFRMVRIFPCGHDAVPTRTIAQGTIQIPHDNVDPIV